MSPEEILSQLTPQPAPSAELLQRLIEKLNFDIDKHYLSFIKNSNGATGLINEQNYIQLWKIEDLIELNPYYPDDEVFENIFVFGSDGGNTAYGILKKEQRFFKCPFLDMPEEVEPCCNTFFEFLRSF